ncbi:MAG: DUF1080 domain-containing protein [Verrucomicrobia bacterium]|nr:DUF1080 domain-containing protein [Verrucomicrobiota bacterium]
MSLRARRFLFGSIIALLAANKTRIITEHLTSKRIMKPIQLFALTAVAALFFTGCETVPSTPGEIGRETGFVSLFNGKDLTGWTLVGKKGDGYGVKDGVIYCAKGGGGNLLTDKEFSNFILRFEFKLESAANNGMGIRAPLTDKSIAYEGMEIQILDYAYDKPIRPEQYHGSIYDLVAAKRGALKPAGNWNVEEIRADGRHIKVTLNGEVIVDADLNSITDPEKLLKHPGLFRERGRIGFLGHNDYCEFRALRIKELPDRGSASDPLGDRNIAPPGFTRLFDGLTLTGWKGLLAPKNDNPVKRALLSKEQLAAEQAKADALMQKDWRVENHTLAYRGSSFNNLVTARDYANFEMFCDWRIEKDSDSGLYLRGTPQVQIWDTLTSATSKTGTSPNQVGSGGLYNNKKAESKPLLRADHLTGEWNRFHIVMVGDKVTVWLNNDLVVRNTPLENYWAPGTPLFETGSIELQAHKTPVWFKNLYLRELPKAAAATK